MNPPSEEKDTKLTVTDSEVVVRAVSEEITPPGTTPDERSATALWILASIALIAALYLARAFIVPLLFGILVSYTLRPIVDWFERYHVPRALGAAFLLATLVGGASWMTFSLSGDAAEMIEQLPDAARKVRQSLNAFRSGGANAMHRVQEAADELQRAVVDSGMKPQDVQVVTRESETTAWVRDFMLTQTALLVGFAAQAPIVLLLTYFLLASGTHFRRKLVQFVGPSLTQKKDAVRILEEVDEQVQRYLLVMLISNTLIAVLTWLAFEMIGLEHAGVWGFAAGVLHFIPYLGTVGTALASSVAALLQFGSLPQALLVASVFLLISGVVGMVFTTWLQGRFAGVNPAVLFIVLLFFGWLWGIAGLLLGAPLLAITKVICDRVEFLKPFGELLGR
ncbi:AI-2E family transporter [Nitrosospira briensis]|uniref:Predicted PurR-regulated permease PerM n=1 Tax=Nitrosospira briensis TaxID=35799 RepID=A0A1I5DCR5_9PROT|nr:AI-2E family transporter [Nitrosospira briensis]SFN97003.1 Predicted PurR-regulated permease PerM [Nitrosospira briensis]SFO20107.1 Predicted PurR-regulated permease PerM [Nitrosospira briensis]